MPLKVEETGLERDPGVRALMSWPLRSRQESPGVSQ